MEELRLYRGEAWALLKLLFLGIVIVLAIIVIGSLSILKGTPMDTTSALPSYIASIARNLLGVGAGWLIGKGYITADLAPELIGGTIGLLTLIWSLIQKRNAHKALTGA